MAESPAPEPAADEDPSTEPPAAAAPEPEEEEEEEEDDDAEEEGVEVKEHLNIVFIGHVDAGKSTIGGQLM